MNEVLQHPTHMICGKEVVVARAAGKDDKGKGKSQRPWKRGSRHDICDARLLPTPPAPPQLPRLLSSSVYRDKYVKNILWNKNIQTKLEFKNLMKTKFGDGNALSLLMLSYWYVAGDGKTRCRQHKFNTDNGEDASLDGPATVRWLLLSDDEEKDIVVLARSTATQSTFLLAV